MKKILLYAFLTVLVAGFAACSSEKGGDLLKQAKDMFKQRKVNEGVKLVERAYAADPGNGEIVNTYAQVSLYTGKTNRALAALEKGMKDLSGEDLKQVASYRAYMLATMGRREEAARAVTEGLKKWPGDQSFLYVQSKMKTMPGAEAPDFSGDLINGGKVSLSGYKGKVVLIDFWASWCKPCRQSMPHLKDLQNKYAAKGLVVLGVNLDKTKQAALGFMQQTGITFPVVYGDDNQKTSALYGVRGIPSTFLVDRKGVIRYSGHPMQLQEGLIKSLL